MDNLNPQDLDKLGHSFEYVAPQPTVAKPAAPAPAPKVEKIEAPKKVAEAKEEVKEDKKPAPRKARSSKKSV